MEWCIYRYWEWNHYRLRNSKLDHGASLVNADVQQTKPEITKVNGESFCGDWTTVKHFLYVIGDGKMVKKDGDFKMDVEENKPAVAPTKK